MPWQPSADIKQLKQRAKVISQIRAFLDARHLLEVDTPVMSHYGVSDPHIDSIPVAFTQDGALSSTQMNLMPSPEYAMKRLLAAGSGSIYQISKAFRNGEIGRKHNPEFTLLEWYQLNYSLEQLMQEVSCLIDTVLVNEELEWHYLSYRTAFESILSIDPLTASDESIRQKAIALVDVQMDADTPRDTWLDLLMSHCIEPALPKACFVFDYPASQCALARQVQDEWGNKVARRFEVYINGIELANGYHELTDAIEQARRFKADNQSRQAMGKVAMAADIRLIQALEAGLPECSGVALGIERLLMLVSGEKDISKVMAFSHHRA